MARSLVADFLIPEVLAFYARQRFMTRLDLWRAAMAGAQGNPIKVVPHERIRRAGNRLKVPLFTRITNLVQRRDLTSETAPTDKKLTGDTRDIPLIRRRTGPIAASEDIFKLNEFTPEQYSMELGLQMGEESAADMQATIFRVINAVMGITFSGISHLLDKYEPYASVSSNDSTGVVGNTLSLGVIAAGKAVLGSAERDLTTMVLHSSAQEDLRTQHFLTGYRIAEDAALDGSLKTVGMNPFVKDLSEFQSANPSGSRTGSGSGTGTASNAQFRTYLMTADAIELVMPHDLDIGMSGPFHDAEAPYFRILGNYDFGAAPVGVGWKVGSPDNPTDAEVLTSTNWEDVTSDHREVGLVVIDHNLVSQP